ncbi:MAG: hypothetical protein Q8P41_21485 [Pseudomonadota bacterium]|nr:hypothetical protein [Pseudomonadota bacterium]
MTTLLLLAACGGDPIDTGKGADDTAGDTDTDTDTDDTGGPDPATVPLAGECTDDAHWGAFAIDSNEDYAYVTGSISNGVVPVSVLTQMMESGDCKIWRRENPFCDPSCDPGYTCDLSGECVTYPTTQDLGVVTVDGLSQPVSMEAVTPGYTYFDTSLPNPPWTPGSLLTLDTSGGAYDPVRLYGVAPAALAPVSMDWVINPGQPLAVAWDAPASAVRTELVLNLRIDQHGLTPSSIECVFTDDGAAEVPSDVIEELMGYGVTGFPAGDLTRRTADSSAIGAGGCIDLVASSSRLAHVEIDGYTPCTRDPDCPDGQTCNEALERCE